MIPIWQLACIQGDAPTGRGAFRCFSTNIALLKERCGVGISGDIAWVQEFSDDTDMVVKPACKVDAPTGRSAFSLLFYQYCAPNGAIWQNLLYVTKYYQLFQPNL